MVRAILFFALFLGATSFASDEIKLIGECEAKLIAQAKPRLEFTNTHEIFKIWREILSAVRFTREEFGARKLNLIHPEKSSAEERLELEQLFAKVADQAVRDRLIDFTNRLRVMLEQLTLQQDQCVESMTRNSPMPWNFLSSKRKQRYQDAEDKYEDLNRIYWQVRHIADCSESMVRASVRMSYKPSVFATAPDGTVTTANDPFLEFMSLYWLFLGPAPAPSVEPEAPLQSAVEPVAEFRWDTTTLSMEVNSAPSSVSEPVVDPTPAESAPTFESTVEPSPDLGTSIDLGGSVDMGSVDTGGSFGGID